jgi:hypothetical protein
VFAHRLILEPDNDEGDEIGRQVDVVRAVVSSTPVTVA